MQIVDISASEIDRGPDSIDGLSRGQHFGLLVRNVFSPEAMGTLTDRLERRVDAFPETHFPASFRGHFFGHCIDLADPGLRCYFECAERFRHSLRSAFAPIGDFSQRVPPLLGALMGGLPVEVPQSPDGRRYSVATIRYFEDDGYIPPHCELEQATRQPYQHLRTLIQCDAIFSYYLMIQPPETGGELCVSTLHWNEITAVNIQNGRTMVNDLVSERPHVKLAPRAGDVVVIHGARFHWVAKCQSARKRWTIGGFFSPARDGKRLLLWA